MKTAKEMFDELGYNDNGNRNSDCELFVYEKTITKSIGEEFYQQGICIIFEVDSTITKMEDNGEMLPITYEEIKAIYQQMKELGWIK